MFTTSVIEECLAGLVGVQQPTDPEVPKIATSLQVTNSGRWLDAFHPLCTTENIFYSAPDFSVYKYPPWSSTAAYSAGDMVNNNKKVYRAKVDIAPNSGFLITNTAKYELVNLFSDWFIAKYNKAASNMMDALQNIKQIQGVGRTLLEMSQLYIGYGTIYDRIIKRGRFVGWEISLASVEGLKMVVEKFGIQADAEQSELLIYLYHSSKKAPIGTFPVEIALVNTFDWQALTDCIIGYLGNGTDASGVWYLGYYENDLEGQAVRKEVDFSKPCPGCDPNNVRLYNQWSQYTTFRAIEVAAEYLDPDNDIFDTGRVQYVSDSNFGMNLQISVSCDLSAVFCRNKTLLAPMFGKQLALDMLNIIAFSNQMSGVADNTRKLAMVELDPKVSGSFVDPENPLGYTAALAALSFDLSGFSSACLPCLESGALTISSI